MRGVMSLFLLTLGGGVLGACVVSEDEYDAVLTERDAMRTRVSQLEDELDKARGKIKELETELSEVKEARPNRPSEKQTAATYAELHMAKGDKIRARLQTSLGDITCDLYPHIAPIAVLNFVALAEGTKEWIDPHTGDRTQSKLYDGTKFHRVIKGFMIQGGDPLGTGRGGPGFQFPDEVWSDVRFDRPGLLAMANSGPDTNGSQFFITADRAAHLNMKHTIFGACDMETVQKILAVPVDTDGATPKTDVVLKHVQILRETPPDKSGAADGGE